MIYEGEITIDNDRIEGELICKDKSDMPAIYTYSFNGDGKVTIITELGDIHNESEGTYEVDGNEIKISSGVSLEKNGDCYYRLLYKKI